jgi:hypothetical protein
MDGSPYSISPGRRAGEMHEPSSGGAGWPIAQASLAALLDTGLSPEQIARYFSVPVMDVTNAIGALAMPLPIGR